MHRRSGRLTIGHSVPTGDVQALLQSVGSLEDDDNRQEDTLHASGPAFDGLSPTFQFTIPDQYDGRPGLGIDLQDSSDDGGADFDNANSFEIDHHSEVSEQTVPVTPGAGSVVADARLNMSGMGSMMSARIRHSELDVIDEHNGDDDDDDGYDDDGYEDADDQFGLPPITASPAAYTPAADLSFSHHHRSADDTVISTLLTRSTTKPAKPTTRLSRLGLPIPSLPRPLIKRLATSFLNRSGVAGPARLSADTVEALALATDWFFEQAAEDVAVYASHAGRKSVDEADVAMLMARQRRVLGRNTTTGASRRGGPSKTVFGLANEMLPRELVRLVRGDRKRVVKRSRTGTKPARSVNRTDQADEQDSEDDGDGDDSE